MFMNDDSNNIDNNGNIDKNDTKMLNKQVLIFIMNYNFTITFIIKY